jgi:hypothetical protein
MQTSVKSLIRSILIATSVASLLGYAIVTSVACDATSTGCPIYACENARTGEHGSGEEPNPDGSPLPPYGQWRQCDPKTPPLRGSEIDLTCNADATGNSTPCGQLLTCTDLGCTVIGGDCGTDGTSSCTPQ